MHLQSFYTIQKYSILSVLQMLDLATSKKSSQALSAIATRCNPFASISR